MLKRVTTTATTGRRFGVRGAIGLIRHQGRPMSSSCCGRSRVVHKSINLLNSGELVSPQQRESILRYAVLAKEAIAEIERHFGGDLVDEAEQFLEDSSRSVSTHPDPHESVVSRSGHSMLTMPARPPAH
jgi:hypothetical protein